MDEELRPMTRREARRLAIATLTAHLHDEEEEGHLYLEATRNRISAARVMRWLVLLLVHRLDWEANERGTTPEQLIEDLGIAFEVTDDGEDFE